jgi:D-lyxose ketol-isomerase
MRRSQIETIIDKSQAAMMRLGCPLPPFAAWTPDDWRSRAAETATMRANFLGWNIVEFAKDDFFAKGIAVFTTRMGDYRDLPTGAGRLYGEKVFVLFDGQNVPHHYHIEKTEDLLNRGGGTLSVNLVKVMLDGTPTDESILLERNGVREIVAANTSVKLAPGESILLEPYVAHAFLGEGEVLCGEISLANDDTTDNYFLEPFPAPSPIIEDVPARHLVVADYRSF